MDSNLYIITNESISDDQKNFFCDNIDLKAIPEELNKNVKTHLIARKSKIARSKKIDIENINTSQNLFGYLCLIKRSFKDKNSKYFIISITPYTFLAIVFLRYFKKKPFVYLRSDGYKEYKSILGLFGPIIYHIMFFFGSKMSKLISCRKHILRGENGFVVHPSQLNDKWFKDYKKININKVSLLYVGRVRVEKGIFSLIEILKDTDIDLSIITSEKVNNLNLPLNIKINIFENFNDSIINVYDDHSILILPSYTEGHPQVLDEALARIKPVIIFEEISHVVRDRKGVFVSKRNIKSLKETINYIKDNYEKIENDIKKNSLPTKLSFINELKTILI